MFLFGAYNMAPLEICDPILSNRPLAIKFLGSRSQIIKFLIEH